MLSTGGVGWGDQYVSHLAKQLCLFGRPSYTYCVQFGNASHIARQPPSVGVTPSKGAPGEPRPSDEQDLFPGLHHTLLAFPSRTHGMKAPRLESSGQHGAGPADAVPSGAKHAVGVTCNPDDPITFLHVNLPCPSTVTLRM